MIKFLIKFLVFFLIIIFISYIIIAFIIGDINIFKTEYQKIREVIMIINSFLLLAGILYLIINEE